MAQCSLREWLSTMPMTKWSWKSGAGESGKRRKNLRLGEVGADQTGSLPR